MAGVRVPVRADKEPQRLVVEGKLRHGADPLLRWCASNLAVTMDSAGNVKPAKDRSAHRIDPIAARVMAIDGWQRFGQAPKRVSVYQKRFRDGDDSVVVIA